MNDLHDGFSDSVDFALELSDLSFLSSFFSLLLLLSRLSLSFSLPLSLSRSLSRSLLSRSFPRSRSRLLERSLLLSLLSRSLSRSLSLSLFFALSRSWSFRSWSLSLPRSLSRSRSLLLSPSPYRSDSLPLLRSLSLLCSLSLSLLRPRSRSLSLSLLRSLSRSLSLPRSYSCSLFQTHDRPPWPPSRSRSLLLSSDKSRCLSSDNLEEASLSREPPSNLLGRLCGSELSLEEQLRLLISGECRLQWSSRWVSGLCPPTRPGIGMGPSGGVGSRGPRTGLTSRTSHGVSSL